MRYYREDQGEDHGLNHRDHHREGGSLEDHGEDN